MTIGVRDINDERGLDRVLLARLNATPTGRNLTAGADAEFLFDSEPPDRERPSLN